MGILWGQCSLGSHLFATLLYWRGWLIGLFLEINTLFPMKQALVATQQQRNFAPKGSTYHGLLVKCSSFIPDPNVFFCYQQSFRQICSTTKQRVTRPKSCKADRAALATGCDRVVVIAFQMRPKLIKIIQKIIVS